MTVEYFGTPLLHSVIVHRQVMTKRTGPIARRVIEQMERESADYPKPTREERAEWHNPLCAHCGHFTSWSADNYTEFGGPTDTDPPESSYLCDRCVAKEIGDAITARRMWSHWIPAAWEYHVAPLIGFGRAGPPGSAWSNWCDSTRSLPAGWVWREGWPRAVSSALPTPDTQVADRK